MNNIELFGSIEYELNKIKIKSLSKENNLKEDIIFGFNHQLNIDFRYSFKLNKCCYYNHNTKKIDKTFFSFSEMFFDILKDILKSFNLKYLSLLPEKN